MLTFILFILSSVGLTFIITHSYIFKGFRGYMDKIKYLGKLFRCTLCFGFWSGMIVRIFMTFNFNIDIILYGFVTSICSYVLYTLIKDKMD